MKLKTIQDKFVTSITTGDFDSELIKGMKELGTLGAERALEVYREDYTVRLKSVLDENYESLWWALGDEEWLEFASEYVSKNPSKAPDLGLYGKDLPEYIKSHSISEDYPFLSELGNFERSYLEVFNQKYSSGLAPEFFAGIENIEQSKFVLNPAMSLGKSEHPILSIWQTASANEDPDSIEWSPEQWLLYRKNSLIFTKRLTPFQFFAMEALIKGLSLSESLDVASSKSADFTESEVSDLFSTLVGAGQILSLS